MKQAFNLCSSSDKISDEEKNYIHFYCGVRSVLFKITKGTVPDISQMNAKVREMVAEAIKSDGVEEIFKDKKGSMLIYLVMSTLKKLIKSPFPTLK